MFSPVGGGVMRVVAAGVGGALGETLTRFADAHRPLPQAGEAYLGGWV